jgi:hypothetical protein
MHQQCTNASLRRRVALLREHVASLSTTSRVRAHWRRCVWAWRCVWARRIAAVREHIGAPLSRRSVSTSVRPPLSRRSVGASRRVVLLRGCQCIASLRGRVAGRVGACLLRVPCVAGASSSPPWTCSRCGGRDGDPPRHADRGTPAVGSIPDFRAATRRRWRVGVRAPLLTPCSHLCSQGVRALTLTLARHRTCVLPRAKDRPRAVTSFLSPHFELLE